MARKRSNIAFNLSFLDVMSCGFGAVVLVFLIIDHAIEVETQETHIDLSAEVDMLEEDVRDGKEGLVKLRNILSDTDFEIATPCLESGCSPETWTTMLNDPATRCFMIDQEPALLALSVTPTDAPTPRGAR